MKKQITTIVLLLIVSGAQAQNYFYKHDKSNNTNRINTLKQVAQSSNKTTGSLWRIVATSTYMNGGTSLELSDSSKYKYTNGRGSAFNYVDLYMDDNTLESAFLYDTALKYNDYGNGIELTQRFSAEYNTANQMTVLINEQKQTTQLENNSKEIAEINTKGNITRKTTQYWDNSQNKWETMFVSMRTYDAQNRLLVDSSYNSFGGSNTPSNKVTYTYDGSGNLAQTVYSDWDGTAMIAGYRTNYTYSNNKKVTSTDQEFVNNTWRNIYMDSTGYNANGVYNYYIYKEWDTLASKWVNSSQEVRTINAKGLPSVIMFSEWVNNKWQTQMEGVMTTDNNDNITSMVAYSYIGGIKIPMPAFVGNYYYENYSGVGINDVAKTSQVTVYPNPASHTINVVLNGQKDAVVSLTNMTGQTVRVVSVADQVQKAEMNVSGLQPGNYILSVQSANAAPNRQMVTIQ